MYLDQTGFIEERRRSEANLSTKSTSSCEEARFPSSNEYPRWPRRAEITSGKRPGSSLRLIHRIRTAHEFSRLDAEGIQVRTDVLWCKFLADPAMSPPRVAFSIGRAHGHAVRRNLARRRLRELLRRQAQMNLLPCGALMVGIIRSKSEHMFDMSPEMLAQQVQKLVEGLPTQ